MGFKVKKGSGGILDIGYWILQMEVGWRAWKLKPLGSRFHALVFLVSSSFYSIFIIHFNKARR